MEDFGSTNAPAPDTVLGGTVVQTILVPPSVGSSGSPHLNLPLHHTVHDLRILQQTNSFNPIDATHLLGRRVSSHSVEGLVKGPSVNLGDGPDGSVEGVQSSRVLPDNLREQTRRNTVADVGGEHFGFSGMRGWECDGEPFVSSGSS